MKTKMGYRYTAYRSSVGMVYLLAGDRGLLALGLGEKLQDFKNRHQKRAPGVWQKVEPGSDELLGRAVRSLKAYFDEGYPLSSDIPLEPVGTHFQMKVWKELRKIPHGRTRSYGQIAKSIRRPKAARAVGGACRANPIPLFIPCHRVLASNGSLGGFGSGLDVKEQLLTLEEIGSQSDFK